MADFGSIDGRPETPGDDAGRLSASELRPVDAAGREWPETTEEGLMADLDVVEREAREAREEAARLRARVAALEAAVAEERAVNADMREAILDLGATLDALIGGAQVQVDARSPNAVIGQAQLKRLRSFAEGHDADRRDVDEAIREAERARVRARVEALYLPDAFSGVAVIRALDQALTAIGGAP